MEVPNSKLTFNLLTKFMGLQAPEIPTRIEVDLPE